jgi:hypothetical protein
MLHIVAVPFIQGAGRGNNAKHPSSVVTGTIIGNQSVYKTETILD